MIPISLTLGNKGLFCAPESQLINSPLSEPEAGKPMFCIHGVVNDSRLVLFTKSSFPHIFFFSLRQTGKCGQRRSGNGAEWGTEAPPCVCPQRYSFWHRRPSTTDSTTWQPRNARSNRKICLQSLSLIANKLYVGAWGNSEDDEHSQSWATAQWPQKNIPVDALLPLFTSEMSWYTRTFLLHPWNNSNIHHFSYHLPPQTALRQARCPEVKIVIQRVCHGSRIHF